MSPDREREAPKQLRLYPEVQAIWNEDQEFYGGNFNKWAQAMILRGCGRLQDGQIEEIMQKYSREKS